jgi:hypothetical protein
MASSTTFLCRPGGRIFRYAVPLLLALPGALILLVMGKGRLAPRPDRVVKAGIHVPASLPELGFHLTARPWHAVGISKTAYLDRMEGIVRFEARLQNRDGAIIDPVARAEWQYATPYYANGLGLLLAAGRARDLADSGLRAMDHVTRQMEGGRRTIPQEHGNFFVAPMAEALDFYASLVSPEVLRAWRMRMKGRLETIVNDKLDINWRTYAMKGAWYRSARGLSSVEDGADYIEEHWARSQKARMTASPWGLYHDFSCSPDTLAYDAIARGNLWQILASGYQGAARGEMEALLVQGARSSLLMQDATGQAPSGGRSGDHVWNDILSGMNFEFMAERAWMDGDEELAGRYRHASMLALASADRWRGEDGHYFVTKNRFPPDLRVGYAAYSQLTNYNGNILYHLGEAFRARRTDIPERPAPAEIGGYAFVPDDDFAVGFAGAGGMQVQISLRGSCSLEHGRYWNTLGITRFSRVGWDSRLGPSDGARDPATGSGISHVPALRENGSWKPLASLPDRYEARLSCSFAHPLLVKCRIEYTPRRGCSGPTFTDDLVITPDGVLSSVASSAENASVLWPILAHDGGEALEVRVGRSTATFGYRSRTDRQNFIAVDASAKLTETPGPIRGAYGDLEALRLESGPVARTFIYPQGRNDPDAKAILASFRHSGSGFRSLVGKVDGTLYIGRFAAGGFGKAIDLDGDGRDDLVFDAPCGFIVQLDHGRAAALETDRPSTAWLRGTKLLLEAYKPVRLD